MLSNGVTQWISCHDVRIALISTLYSTYYYIQMQPEHGAGGPPRCGTLPHRRWGSPFIVLCHAGYECVDCAVRGTRCASHHATNTAGHNLGDWNFRHNAATDFLPCLINPT
jgi:hypothetical protein